MKTIKNKAQHEKALEEVYNLMNKGSENVTPDESDKIREHALAIQDYEMDNLFYLKTFKSFRKKFNLNKEIF